MNTKKIRRNYTLRITENSIRGKTLHTHSIRLFYRHLRSIIWGNKMLQVYVKVSYGRHEDNNGKQVTFYNDGRYTNQKDLWQAVDAFMEEQAEHYEAKY